MPGAVEESEFRRIDVRPLHATFAAEVAGVDWTNVDEETLQEVKKAVDKYGVCVFRDTGMDDTAHVEFSRRLGDLDDIKRFIQGNRKMRYAYYELFDAGNVDADDNILDADSPRAHANRGNGLFHSDSTYNPRRASYSLLRAVVLPPKGSGGNTEFADVRTAYEALPQHIKDTISSAVGAHTFAQSRKLGSPEYFANLDPERFKMARHHVAQMHHESGQMTLYIGAHLHHIEGLGRQESDELRDYLNRFATREEYRVSVEWEQPGDLVIWDNRSTLHRAVGGSFAGKHRRDMRRTTVHDDGPNAWGLNEVGESFASFGLENIKAAPVEARSG